MGAKADLPRRDLRGQHPAAQQCQRLHSPRSRSRWGQLAPRAARAAALPVLRVVVLCMCVHTTCSAAVKVAGANPEPDPRPGVSAGHGIRSSANPPTRSIRASRVQRAPAFCAALTARESDLRWCIEEANSGRLGMSPKIAFSLPASVTWKVLLPFRTTPSPTVPRLPAAAASVTSGTEDCRLRVLPRLPATLPVGCPCPLLQETCQGPT